MDKRVIFAVAGSGKTTYIINKLTLGKRFLIITYTNNNIQTLRTCIIKKFGYFPSNIRLQSYFSFLHSFCFKPLLSNRIRSKGINWHQPPAFTFKLNRNNRQFYLDKNSRLYNNRIAKLCETRKVLTDINNRIEKYYDYLFIDEIQDFGGHDFNLLKSIVTVNCEILFVGDFFQHTFDTSKDGTVNQRIYDDYDSYKELFQNMGLLVDTTTLKNSYRCSRTVCDFIQNSIGIPMSATSERISDVKFINNQPDIDNIINNNVIVKLFYQEHYKYNCYSQNWGSSKGIDHFNDVCVILNKNTKKVFDKGEISSLPQQTKNKLYVACSRARNHLYFISDGYVKK
jgi:hypothetical protein